MNKKTCPLAKGEYSSTFVANSPEETESLAAKISRDLKEGDCLALSGPLGSGKTVFVKGLAKALGVREVVKSPTFNLLHIYSGGKLPIYHFDFYRLDEGDLEDLGFVEYVFDSDGIAVLEWAEKVSSGLPSATRWVTFEITGENERKITLKSPAL